MVYLYLSQGENRAAIFAFLQGLFLSIYSGTNCGIFPFSYVLVLIFVLIISNFLDVHTKSGSILCVSLALLFKYLLLSTIMYLVFEHQPIDTSFLKELLIRFLLTVSLSSTIFSALNKIRYAEVF